MTGAIKLGRIAGLDLSAEPSALAGFLVVWVALSAVGLMLPGLSAGEAILGGLLAAILHWCAGLLHQLGHARAARRTGYPMIGIQLWWFLGRSQYPADEPPLPRAVHI